MKKLVMMMVALGMAVAAVAAQCEATTLMGTQCKRQAQEGNALCWQHAKMAGVNKIATCQAKTADGTQCSRKVEGGAKFCWQHAKAKAEKVAADATEAVEKPAKKARAKAKKAADEATEAAEKPAKAARAKAKKVAEAADDAKAAVAGRCQAKTADGEQCKRKAVPGKKFCFQHAK